MQFFVFVGSGVNFSEISVGGLFGYLLNVHVPRLPHNLVRHLIRVNLPSFTMLSSIRVVQCMNARLHICIPQQP